MLFRSTLISFMKRLFSFLFCFPVTIERVRTEKEKSGIPEAKTKEAFHKTDLGKFIDMVGEGLRKVVPFFK